MSFNDGWRNIRNMNELMGAIKNALERGQSMESARQSLANAGYKQEEIEEALKSDTPAISMIQADSKYPALPTLKSEKKKSNTGLIISIVLALLIVISAGILGLYWDKVSKLLGI